MTAKLVQERCQSIDLFVYTIGILPGEKWLWSLAKADNLQRVERAVLELAVEQDAIGREVSYLERRRRDLFSGRCLLAQAQASLESMRLPVPGRADFAFRELLPLPTHSKIPTAMVIDDRTDLSLFVPHQKGSVDMVVVIDGAGSMDLHDYVDSDGQPRPRLEGVRVALEALIQRRLRSITRVSKIALVVFGGNTRTLYPPGSGDMAELDSELIAADLTSQVGKLNQYSLQSLGVDRNHTIIPQDLQFAAEMLDYHSQEGNEKTILLLSDGAHWHEEQDDATLGEVVYTMADPATLADDLHYVSQIRIHTIAISDEQALARYEPRYQGHKDATPNPKLLEFIAKNSHGHFFKSPDATDLAKLFDELGKGMLYPPE